MQEEHSLFLFLFGTFFKPYLTLRKKPLNMAKTCENMKKKMLFFNLASIENYSYIPNSGVGWY